MSDKMSRVPDHNKAEEVILNHIASFRRRYNSLYPRGPLLLLTPKNENYCQKSIISFVVPSLVPFAQLLNLTSAAQVLADLITYTPPSKSSSVPSQLRQPRIVIEKQTGEGAECAIALASILLGAGYQAFVVQGHALDSLVSADTSSKVCPYLDTEEKEKVALEDTSTSKYTVRPPPDMRSRYTLIMEERARRRKAFEEEELAKLKKKKKKDQNETEADTSVDLSSSLHFWVLVLPPDREIESPTFVEPTTGEIIILSPSVNHPYTYVHSVFNHKNYWACTQYEQAITAAMFNLDDSSMWMVLMEKNQINPPTPAKQKHPVPSAEEVTQHEEGVQVQPPKQSGSEPSSSPRFPKERDRKRKEKELKIPKTWASPIIVKEEALRLRFPGGWREEKYKQTLVRRYSPFTHKCGATLVLTIYDKSGTPSEIREEFERREDGLLTRVSDLMNGRVVETFARSRKDTLKHHEYWRSPSSLNERATPDGVNNPSSASINKNHTDDSNNGTSSQETFMFHSKFRVDALRCRIIGGTKWREEFDERSDLLLARTVYFSSSDPAPPRAIQRIEEEFDCPKNVEPHTAVQKRIFHISEGRILLIYHYGKHRLLQATRSFIKPTDTRTSTLTPDMTHGFQPDPSVEDVPMPQLWNTLQEEMEAEVRVGEEVRKGVEETATLRAARANEEKKILLVPDIFDIDRNETVQYILKQRQYQEAHREETERKKKEEREGHVDTIAPYMPLLLGDDADMGPDMVRERCLQDLRDRLALRANLLQDRLDQAKAYVLECREELSRRKRLGADERSLLTARTTAAEASHRRLRAQLAAWKHEASERYESLTAQLDANLKLGLRNLKRPSTSVSSNSGAF
ncbi:dynein regulatory complex subunit 7 [Palaemon carinicauda]|uniref:dynein regulatory complex subunit 7 n=1 Tax=Palaemon carinicauda TaxID=392227 RepID=UPI0035B69634